MPPPVLPAVIDVAVRSIVVGEHTGLGLVITKTGVIGWLFIPTIVVGLIQPVAFFAVTK